MTQEVIDQLKQRYDELKRDYSDPKIVHEDLKKWVAPELGFFDSKDKEIERDGRDIINNVVRLAKRDFVNGLFAYVANPNAEWFKLVPTVTDDLGTDELDESLLFQLTNDLRNMIASSNIYQNMISMYDDISVFGNGVMLLLDNVKSSNINGSNALVSYTYQQGTYLIGDDHTGTVDIFARKYKARVKQIMKQFPDGQYSDTLKQHIQNKRFNEELVIIHMITDPAFIESNRIVGDVKEWYYEDTAKDTILYQSEFDRFPVLCTRYKKVCESAYSKTSPALICLGDNKELQKIETELSKIGAEQLNPILAATRALFDNMPKTLKPGGIVPIDDATAANQVVNLKEVRYDEKIAIDKVMRFMESIKDAFMLDMFKALSMRNNTGRTAQEVKEIENEKLTMIGTLLESLNRGFLEPLIEQVIQIMRKNKLSIFSDGAEVDFKVQFVSIMHKSQREQHKIDLEQFMMAVQNIGGMFAMELPNMINPHALLKKYAQACELDSSSFLVDEQEYEQIKLAQQQAMQQAQAMEQAKGISESAKNLENVDGEQVQETAQQLAGGQMPVQQPPGIM